MGPSTPSLALVLGLTVARSGDWFAAIGGAVLAQANAQKLTLRGRLINIAGGLYIAAIAAPVALERMSPHPSGATERATWAFVAFVGMATQPLLFRGFEKYVTDRLGLTHPTLGVQTEKPSKTGEPT